MAQQNEILVPEVVLTKEQRIALFDQQFAPIRKAFEQYREKLPNFKVTDASQVDRINESREARLLIRSKRLEAEKLHKELKAEALFVSQNLDKIMREIKALAEPMETELYNNENFVKVQEENRKAKLNTERLEIVSQYMDRSQAVLTMWGEMDEMIFENMVEGLKLKKAQAEKAEEERKQEVERNRKENEKKTRYINRLTRLTNMGAVVVEDSITLVSKEDQERQVFVSAKTVMDQTDEIFEMLVSDFAKIYNANLAFETKKRDEENRRKEKEEEEKKNERKVKRGPDRSKLLLFADEIDKLDSFSLRSEEGQYIRDHAKEQLVKISAWIRKQVEKEF